MNAETLLAHVTNAAFVFIFFAVLAEAVRTRRPLAVDAALFFGAVVLIVASSTLLRLRLLAPSELQSNIVVGLLLLLPYLQLRMVHDFERVPRRVRAVSAAVGIASALSLFLVQRPFGGPYIVAVLVGFLVVQCYCTLRLISSMRGTTGVARARTQALALGSAMLVVVMLMVGLIAFFPEERIAWRAVSSVASLLCGLGYFIGFTPPRWLRTLWQGPAIREFLSTAARLPLERAPAELATELEAAVIRAVGSQRAAIRVWDEEQRALVLLRSGERGRLTPDRAATSPTTRVFEEQRALAMDDAPREDPANADLYDAVQARSVLIAPITLGDQRFGVLSTFTNRASNFVQDDIALIRLLADEVAGLLERHQLTQAAAHVRAQEDAARLKDEFLSAAAHDLRTPLTVVLAQAQMLQRRLRRLGDEAQQDLGDGIDRLVAEAQRMRRLTDDVLDASRAEATGFVNEVAPTDLVAVAEEIAASVTSERHKVVVSGGHAEALVDAGRIRQVMQNLVDNAVKFSPAGGTITIDCEQQARCTTFTVEDQGIGIPPWDVPHLFQRFYRGSRTGERGFSGMGIGLFLCKRIVEEHGGSIAVESVYGRGTRFHVSLPQVCIEQEEDECPSAFS